MEWCLRDMLVQDEETKHLETFAFRTGRDTGYFQLPRVVIESL